MANILQYIFVMTIVTDIIILEVDKEHADRLEKEGFICGKIRGEDSLESPAQSRVINGGVTSNNKYPWLATILKTVYRNGGTKYDFWRSGGSIISQKTIHTCIHCVCIHAGNQIPKSEETCLTTPDGKSSVNQNREKENEVRYSIGVQPESFLSYICFVFLVFEERSFSTEKIE